MMLIEHFSRIQNAIRVEYGFDLTHQIKRFAGNEKRGSFGPACSRLLEEAALNDEERHSVRAGL